MATIQNERDKLLQAAAVRFIPPPIDPSLIPGYEDALEDIADLWDEVDALGDEIDHVMNNSKELVISATALTFTRVGGATTPASTTLTAVRGSGLTGTVNWAVVAGSATLSSSTGNSITVTGSTIIGRSATIRARVTMGGVNHDAFVTLTRLGQVAASDVVNLTNQVTGALAASNTTGFGALALLNTVNLNTQTTGALNGLTQLTNMGTLAYANAIAANQIGAGQLAVGVIYAGYVNATQVNAGTMSGVNLSGSNSIYITGSTPDNSVAGMYSAGGGSGVIQVRGSVRALNSGGLTTAHLNGVDGSLTVTGDGQINGLTTLTDMRVRSGGVDLFRVNSSGISGTIGSLLVQKGWAYGAVNLTIPGVGSYTGCTLTIN